MLTNPFKTKYYYALIRYVPNPERGEGLNVGLVIRDNKSQLVRWNDAFNPKGVFKQDNSWSKQVMFEWKKYFFKELTLSSALGFQKDHVLSEEFWEYVRTRSSGLYSMGAPLLMLSNQVDINKVADDLFTRLVARGKKTQQPRVFTLARQFLMNNHFKDSNAYRYPVQERYIFEDQRAGVSADSPFYQKNGVFRPIWTLTTTRERRKPTDKTDQVIGHINRAIDIFKETQRQILSDTENAQYECIVLTSGLEEDDANVRALKYAQIKNLDLGEQRVGETLEYFSNICSPMPVNHELASV